MNKLLTMISTLWATYLIVYLLKSAIKSAKVCSVLTKLFEMLTSAMKYANVDQFVYLAKKNCNVERAVKCFVETETHRNWKISIGVETETQRDWEIS